VLLRAVAVPTEQLVPFCEIFAGMWLERFLIVVPQLEHRYLTYDRGSYRPAWVEFSITVRTCMGVIRLYVLLAKFVPIISIWELKGKDHTIREGESGSDAGYYAHRLLPSGGIESDLIGDSCMLRIYQRLSDLRQSIMPRPAR
jgi:hypothetical protein